MSEEHSGVSRRATLKSLGAAGAVLVLGGTAADARQAEPKPSAGSQDKASANPVDVALARFSKGHS